MLAGYHWQAMEEADVLLTSWSLAIEDMAKVLRDGLLSNSNSKFPAGSERGDFLTEERCLSGINNTGGFLKGKPS